MAAETTPSVQEENVYQNAEIPDEDLRTSLKVLRTLRNLYMNEKTFSTDIVLIFSAAHSKLQELRRFALEYHEDHKQKEGTPNANDQEAASEEPQGQDPDFQC